MSETGNNSSYNNDLGDPKTDGCICLTQPVMLVIRTECSPGSWQLELNACPGFASCTFLFTTMFCGWFVAPVNHGFRDHSC